MNNDRSQHSALNEPKPLKTGTTAKKNGKERKQRGI